MNFIVKGSHVYFHVSMPGWVNQYEMDVEMAENAHRELGDAIREARTGLKVEHSSSLIIPKE